MSIIVACNLDLERLELVILMLRSVVIDQLLNRCHALPTQEAQSGDYNQRVGS